MNLILPIDDALYLSEYQSTDAPTLVEFLNDIEIARNTSTIPYPYTSDDAHRWLQMVADGTAQNGGPSNWAIRHEIKGLVGGIGIFLHKGWTGHFDELGYWLGAPYRGQGWMSKTVLRFTEWQFELRPGLLRMEAWVYAHNTPSQRVLENAGFQREGVARKRFLKNGDALDGVLFGRLRD